MAENKKTKPTGVAMTYEEEYDKFQDTLMFMINEGYPLRKALREAKYGAAKFYEYLEGVDLKKFTGAEIEFKGTLIVFTEELIRFTVEERQKQYVRAREILVENFLYETIEIADDDSNDTIEKTDMDGNVYYVPNVARLQRTKQMTDARQWHITKVMARKYGNNIEHTVVGDKDKPVVVLSLGSGINPEAE